MKNDFDGAQLREKLLKWSRTAAAWRQLQSKVDHGGTGASEANAEPLPADGAQQSPSARCEWALQQLAKERQNIGAAQNEQARGGTLRDQLLNLQGEKQTKERARSRKLMFRLAAVAVVPLAIAVLAGAFWWQHRPPRLDKDAVEQSINRALAGRGLTVSSVTFAVGAAQGNFAPGPGHFQGPA